MWCRIYIGEVIISYLLEAGINNNFNVVGFFYNRVFGNLFKRIVWCGFVNTRCFYFVFF